MSRIHNWLCILCIALGSGASAADKPSAKWEFELQIDAGLRSEPFTGRVYVFTTKSDQEPRRGPNWFRPEPFVSLDVADWAPEEPLTISSGDPQLRVFPPDMRSQSLDGMRVQALARFNPLQRQVGSGPGNGFSPPQQYRENPSNLLRIDQLVPVRPFEETASTKLLTVPSELLSQFHGRPVELRAAVTLPASYGSSVDRRYPVILEIPGFGGTHRMGTRRSAPPMRNDLGVEFIRVMLDPSCPLGHHVFANSDTNGPYGDALVREFLPALDTEYRTDPRPEARFLTGHSSGGWSSFWLQVTYPATFGGTWSTSPDPVDFRDFQRINIYRPGENMFVDPDGNRRPLARRNGQVMVWYDMFSHMEDVLGDGGQLRSFEAVFSPAGEHGPRRLWNRQTGNLIPEVAEAWKRYDIRLILEENWQDLSPRLTGKLHVYMGTEDTFYLEGATQLLKESLERLESDAVVEMLAGRDHGNLFQGGLHERIEQSMAEKYMNSLPQ